jgi:predicted Zn-ribbon and HTH transcriptional regulator
VKRRKPRCILNWIQREAHKCWELTVWNKMPHKNIKDKSDIFDTLKEVNLIYDTRGTSVLVEPHPP